jgi:hypothetical protein
MSSFWNQTWYYFYQCTKLKGLWGKYANLTLSSWIRLVNSEVLWERILVPFLNYY